MQMLGYRMLCNERVVNKIPFLNAIKNYNITIKKSTSFLNPIIIIEDVETPIFNYVFIEGFSRFYFVTDIISLSNNVWEVHLHVDVLNFITDTQKAFIERQQNDYNEFLIDNNRKFTKGYEVNEYTITNDFFGIQDSLTSPRWLLVGMGVDGE